MTVAGLIIALLLACWCLLCAMIIDGGRHHRQPGYPTDRRPYNYDDEDDN